MTFFKDILKKAGLSSPASVKDKDSEKRITVLYGTQSGNSEFIAREASEYMKKKGMKTICRNMSGYSSKELTHENVVLIVVSTHGEGEPPVQARKFYRELSQTTTSLANLKYAVCALGDSSYSFFCEAGVNIDRMLKEKGAQSLFERTVCDVEFREPAIQWIKNTYNSLSGREITAPAQAVRKEVSRTWITGIVDERYPLYKNAGDKECWHISLATRHPVPEYEPGDCIGIMPVNDQDLVGRILTTLSCRGDELIDSGGGLETLQHALLHKTELTTLTPALLQQYNQYAASGKLKDLLDNDDKLKEYVGCRDVSDMLNDFPSNIGYDDLLKILHPLAIRYYSVASGNPANKKIIDIAVRSVQFDYCGRTYQGACSVPLCKDYAVGHSLSFFIKQNNNFRLPSDTSSPIIMIGSGTGLAPFRAFLQDISHRQSGRKTWIIAGDRNSESGVIYQEDFEDFHKKGVLTRFDTVFSRDTATKNYVQHHLYRNGREFIKWMDSGAHLFVCGSIKMADDVKNSIVAIVREQKNLSNDEALAFLQDLRREKRYSEDVY
jgi:sulfite reductase (NADPH) flavoprotein alpha-component